MYVLLYTIWRETFAGLNFHKLDEVEKFTNKLSRTAKATPRMCMYIQMFVDKTFVEGGYAAKFAKVFTRESFRLYCTS